MPGFLSGEIPGVSTPMLPPAPTAAAPSWAMPGGITPGSVTPLAPSTPPPSLAPKPFPGPGLYSLNGRMWPIYDAEQWAAYASQNPTFIGGPGTYGMNAQGAYASLSAPAGIPGAAPAGIPGGGVSTGIPPAPAGVIGGPITGPVTGNVAPPVLPPGTGVPAGIPGGQQTNVFNAIPFENLTIAQMETSNAVELQRMRDTVQRETTAAQERIATLDRQLQEKQVLSNIATQAGNLTLAQQHEADASKLAWDKFREEQRIYGINDEFRKKEFELQQEIERAKVSQGQQGQNLQRAGFLANLLANPPAMLQNARTLTPELVSYIEGGNMPFQQLLENRTLRPTAPGGY